MIIMWKRPFILFFSLLLLAFLLYWPPHYSDYKENMENPMETLQGYKGIITMMDFPHPTEKDPAGFSWIREEISKFQKQNPGVVIDLIPLNYRDGYTRLESAVRTGVYPDIAPVGGIYWYISKDILEPLNKYINNKDDYMPGVIDQVSKDGNVYGLPWAITADVLFENKDLLNSFESNGTENPTALKFEDILTMLEEKNKSKKNEKFYALGGYIGIDDYSLLPFLFKDGRIYNGEGVPEFGIIKEGYIFFSDLNKRGLLTKNFGTTDKEKAWDEFIYKGTTVFMPYNLSGILKLNGESSTKYDVVSYPFNVATTKRVIAYSVFKQSDQKKAEMIMKFLNQITSEDKQVKLKDFYLMPVYQSKARLYAGDRQMEKVLDTVNNIQYLPKNQHFEMLDEIIKTHLRQVVLGMENADEAAKEVEIEYNEYISALP